jgi:hypothetical protein
MGDHGSAVPITALRLLLVLLAVAGLALSPAILLDRIPAETHLTEHYGPWWSSGTPREYISGGDSFFVYLPDRLAAVREWKAGRLPLWNPYVGGGMPILGMQTANPFDPLIALHLGLSSDAGSAPATAALLFVAGLGWCSSCTHGASGILPHSPCRSRPQSVFISWLELRVFLAGLATLPLALWALDDLVLGARRPRLAGILALCVGYAAVAGTLQTLALYLGVLALRMGWNALELRRRGSPPASVVAAGAPLPSASWSNPVHPGRALFRPERADRSTPRVLRRRQFPALAGNRAGWTPISAPSGAQSPH